MEMYASSCSSKQNRTIRTFDAINILQYFICYKEYYEYQIVLGMHCNNCINKGREMVVVFQAFEFSHTREREPNERNSEKNRESWP